MKLDTTYNNRVNFSSKKKYPKFVFNLLKPENILKIPSSILAVPMTLGLMNISELNGRIQIINRQDNTDEASNKTSFVNLNTFSKEITKL